MANKSITGYLAIMFIFIFIVSCSVIKIYAEPGLPWHSYITLLLGYFSAFSILLIVIVLLLYYSLTFSNFFFFFYVGSY